MVEYHFSHVSMFILLGCPMNSLPCGPRVVWLIPKYLIHFVSDYDRSGYAQFPPHPSQYLFRSSVQSLFLHRSKILFSFDLELFVPQQVIYSSLHSTILSCGLMLILLGCLMNSLPCEPRVICLISRYLIPLFLVIPIQ